MNFAKRIKSILTSLILVLITATASSQYYSTGQDPSRVKWMQIKTGKFTVIYPESYGQGGIDFARSLEQADAGLTYLFPEKKLRIPVIIHNFTTQSNGYVAWAPKRMEIYPTPDQNTIPLHTNQQLALHELTHVLQMESLNAGFSRVMGFIFGEQFPGAVAAFLPLWFMEGEAVFAESILTQSGRGRSPFFQNQLKAIAVEKGSLYKYDKMLNGSFRNYTPDHYQFGYQMVTWSILKNDPDLWNNVLDFTANQPFTLNPVNISLKRSAGLKKKLLYIQTFDTLSKLWKEEIEESGAIKYEPLNPDKRGKYINYHSPVFAGRDSIIAIKTSLSDPPSFVLIRPSLGNEKKIHIPGYIYPWFLSYSGGNMVWVETVPDPRWENRNFSVIKIKNIETGEIKQITHVSRYMSAAISPDAFTIAACENTPDNRNSLILIKPANGEIISGIPAPGNASLQHPQWTADGKGVTVIYLTEEGEGAMTWFIDRQEWIVHLSPSRDDLQAAFLRNDSLFYISSVSGTDNLYVLTPGNKTMQITRSRFGVSDLSVRWGEMLFSDYTSDGKEICISGADNSSPAETAPVKPSSWLIERFDPPAGNSSEIPESDLTPVRYRKWQHLFGIHSWMPVYADIEAVRSDPAAIRPGAMVMSQNQLSTLTTTIGYEYTAGGEHMFHSRIIWEGWYPVIESRVDYGSRPLAVGDSVPLRIDPGLRFTNTISLPLSFSTGRFRQNLYFSLSSAYERKYVYLDNDNFFDAGQTQVTGRAYFANIHRSAFRDIYPRYGQVLDLSYTSAPFDKKIYGTDFAFRSVFYFPGLLKNNGIKFRFESEKLSFEGLLTSNRNSFPRGYNNIISRDLSLFSVDYIAPLAYPDFNLGSFVYMNRIRTSLFIDYARGTENFHLGIRNGLPGVVSVTRGTETFKSFGIELVSDLYLLRIPYPVTAGVQASWKSFGQLPALQFIFNIDIYGMNIGRSGL